MAIDKVIKNVRIVRPGSSGPEQKDIGIHQGRFCEIEDDISVD